MNLSHAYEGDTALDLLVYDRISQKTYNLTPLLEIIDEVELLAPDGDDAEWNLKAADVIDDFMLQSLPAITSDDFTSRTDFMGAMQNLWRLKRALQQVQIVEPLSGESLHGPKNQFMEYYRNTEKLQDVEEGTLFRREGPKLVEVTEDNAAILDFETNRHLFKEAERPDELPEEE